MDTTFLRLIELVRKVLKNENELNSELFPDIQDVDMWKKVYGIAMRQEVQVFLYEATKDLDLPQKVKDNFYSVYNRAVRKEAIMHLEVSKYFEALDNDKITYLPIKGWKLKNLYEKPYLRTMTDVDLIVREDGFEKACQLAKACGFHLEIEGESHYVFMKKPVTELEVHHQLFSKDSVLHQWGKDILQNDDGFSMRDEDAYVYLIAHMAKHFTKDGAGMRNIVDCYLFNKQYTFNDEQQTYIKDTLKKLGLAVFEQRIRQLTCIWFDGGEYDEAARDVATYIMDGGLYGKKGNRGTLDVVSGSNSKVKWLLKEIFPDFEFLKRSLGYKKMYKIFTPVYWLIRIIRSLFFKDRIKARTTVIAKDKQELDKSKQLLKYMGLNTIKY